MTPERCARNIGRKDLVSANEAEHVGLELVVDLLHCRGFDWSHVVVAALLTRASTRPYWSSTGPPRPLAAYPAPCRSHMPVRCFGWSLRGGRS